MLPHARSQPRRFVEFVAAVFLLALGCTSRRSGPNEAYLDPKVSANDWDRLFTSPARELFAQRELIVRLADVKPGMIVADVGAGTGLFTMMLSDAVGANGRVYGEEIIAKFSRFIAESAAKQGRENVVSVVGTELSVGLPPDSIDRVFLCDVYHHFSHPGAMLASIRRALRNDGELFLVEFRREPGGPAWVFHHVRAGEGNVIREFETAGFEGISRDNSLRDSYIWRFRRSSRAEQKGPEPPVTLVQHAEAM